ncbi:MAG TPA: AAA family ATPase [Candidatus Pacearchaeota archaeon]|mgnify:CR=1 FL=1|nr:AAA family ATPase [Candidatus Pacearchaeota archaeon]
MNDSKENNLIIVVGGPGSSGSSTIAKMLAEHFKLERVYAGGIFREFVKNLGYENLDDFYNKEKKEKFFELDKKVDDYLIERAKVGNVLIESKVFGALSFKENIPCTVKIWLDSSLCVRVKRFIGKQDNIQGIDKILLYVKTVFNLTRRRIKDGLRYKELYGIDYNKQEMYNNIVLNTSKLNAKETFDLILEKIKDGKYIE